MSYRQAASRAFTPSPQMAAQVPRTRDIDTLLGVMLSTNPAVPLRRKYDVAVRMKSYLPMYVYASLLRIAMSIAGKEIVEAELRMVNYSGNGENTHSSRLAERVLCDIYEDIVRNIELVRKTSPELGLDAPPALGDVWSDGVPLANNVKSMYRAISDYYLSQVAKWERERDMLMFAYASGVLAAAIIDPLRAVESKLA